MALELKYRKLAAELSTALKYEKEALEHKIQEKTAIYDLLDVDLKAIKLPNSSNADLEFNCTAAESQFRDSKDSVLNAADYTLTSVSDCPVDAKNGGIGPHRMSNCPIGDHCQTLHAATASGAPIVVTYDHKELSSHLTPEENGFKTLLDSLNEANAAYILDGGYNRAVCMQRLMSCPIDQLGSLLHEHFHSRIIWLELLRETLENVKDSTQFLLLVKLGLLNPWTTELVATACPCPSLTLLVDLLQDFSVDGHLLERLLLATRVSRDPRLWRYSAYYLKKAAGAPGKYLAALFAQQVPLQTFAYRVLLLYNIQHLFHPLQLVMCFNSKLEACRSGMLDIINYPSAKFHTIRLKRFNKIRVVIKKDDVCIEDGRLLRIEDHISLKRCNHTTSDSGIVNLDFTNQVLSDLYRGVDASIGVYVVGVGKKFHIRELAHRLGVSSVGNVYLDGSTDYKTLIGNWQCTSSLEKFEFTYGILTVAMQQGRWLVFDKNMSDSIAALLNGVVGSGHLYIPETLETICAHPNFNFFVTEKSDGPAESEEFLNCCTDGRFAKLPLVYIPTPNSEHLLQITKAKYPRLNKILPSVLNAYNAAAQSLKDLSNLKITHLLRVCKRLDQGEYNYDGFLSTAVKGYILECFYTVCVSGLSCKEHRMDLMKCIGSCFDLDGNDSVNSLLLLRHDVSGDETSVHSTVLRQLMSCFVNDESVLLVGETGTGKTAIVQRFAQMTGNHLCVYVFNEQSDATDLIGNYYPDNLPKVACSLLIQAMQLHGRTCVLDNCLIGYFDHLQDLFVNGYYKLLINTLCLGLNVVLGFNNVQCGAQVQQLISACKFAISGNDSSGGSSVPNAFLFELKPLYKSLHVLDAELETIIDKYRRNLSTGDEGIAFKFKPGILLEAMTEGKWILLDEINLAPNDLLQRLVGVVGNEKVFELYECGYESIKVHDNFRLFACMNPPMIKLLNSITWTSGKRALPIDFKAKFTEVFVDEVNTFDDVYKICKHHFKALHMSNVANELCRIYLEIKRLCDNGQLEDGSCNAPVFSLRNLVRAIEYINHVASRSFAPIRDGTQALADAIISTFGSFLDANSLKKIEALLPSPQVQKHNIPSTSSIPQNMLVVQDYLLSKGNEPLTPATGFIVVPSVEANLKKLCRILSGLRVPILLEGPTATGKTSLVQYLCERTGHKCIRINNHEHTDVADYLGQFVFDSSGKRLVFNYGPLVDAMIHGHWVILDELNLAPSQVLEALNRILDDNRQVYIPETGQVVTAHPEFMVFATQNPANTIYGGRKQLSRAFCNRFVQIYVEAPNAKDLELILHHKCCIPLSRSQKIVNVYQELQTVPMNSMAFDRQSTFVTLRDLIKWANRVARHDELLAEYGWRLIAEKLRNRDDQETVKEIIERHCLGSIPSKPKMLRVHYENDPDVATARLAAAKFAKYIWIPQTTDRMIALVQDALNHNEAVLLIGETGIGKTTTCALLAALAGTNLNTFSFHKHTEASDFIGGYKPVHGNNYFYTALESLLDYATANLPRTPMLESCFNNLRMIADSKCIKIPREEFEELISQIQNATSPKRALDMEQQIHNLMQDVMSSFPGSLFEWHDGPLTRSMELGEWFLADELNLAEDAVLEKMNSVLESPATLAIPEAGHEHLRVVHGHANFRFLATMNPGGDHGKRELSPALLNRFTIVHVPNVTVANSDIVQMLCRGQPPWVVEVIINVARACDGKLTLRDLVAWIDYVCKPRDGGDANVNFNETLDALAHGAHVVFLDHNEAPITSYEFMDILERICPGMPSDYKIKFYSYDWLCNLLPQPLQVHSQLQSIGFDVGAQASLGTIAKLVRALAFNRPILIEGEPGVGKTAAVGALAKLYSKRLVRVNLSEQTDLSDLLGSNIPCTINGKMGFAWNDGPLLSAMVGGDWILLDELNLASQQVLEGLNAILDHRREIFIPELGRTVVCAAEFRLFGCQNSALGGGGRRLLPKSLLNRFTKIYANCLSHSDSCQVLRHKFPNVPPDVVVKLVDLFEQLKVMMPSWEWNLRDAQRFLSMFTPDVYHGSLDAAFKSNVRRLVLARSSQHCDHNLVALALQFGEGGKSAQAPEASIFELEPSPLSTRAYDDAAAADVCQVSGLLWTHKLDALVSCIDSLLPLPALITGPVNSGKRKTVEYYAASKGKRLVKLDLYPCCDAFDLLGNFEHLNTGSVATQFKACLDQLLLQLNLLNAAKYVNFMLLELIEAFESCTDDNWHGKHMQELLRQLKTRVLATTGNVYIKQLINRLLELLEGCSDICTFRWVDSQLIEAMEAGHWVLICNVHLIEPAVMDRLIPLMEENGTLRLNESGTTRLVHPHKNFRLFFTANSDNLDKISRPFRNRCIELNVNSVAKMHTRRAPVSFLIDLEKQVSNLLSPLVCNFQLDCRALIDGLLIAHAYGVCWNDALLMSLVNCAIVALLPVLAPMNDARKCDASGWQFLQHWASLDVDFASGFSLVARPLLMKFPKISIARACLDVNVKHGQALLQYLAACCNVIYSKIRREWALVTTLGTKDLTCALLWFATRNHAALDDKVDVWLSGACQGLGIDVGSFKRFCKIYASVNNVNDALNAYMALDAIASGVLSSAKEILGQEVILQISRREPKTETLELIYMARFILYILENPRPSGAMYILDELSINHLVHQEVLRMVDKLKGTASDVKRVYETAAVGQVIRDAQEAQKELILHGSNVKECEGAIDVETSVDCADPSRAVAQLVVGRLVGAITLFAREVLAQNFKFDPAIGILAKLRELIPKMEAYIPKRVILALGEITRGLERISGAEPTRVTARKADAVAIELLYICGLAARHINNHQPERQAQREDFTAFNSTLYIDSLVLGSSKAIFRPDTDSAAASTPVLGPRGESLIVGDFWSSMESFSTLGNVQVCTSQIQVLETLLLSVNTFPVASCQSRLYMLMSYTSPIIAKALETSSEAVKAQLRQAYASVSSGNSTEPEELRDFFTLDVYKLSKFIMVHAGNPNASRQLCIATGLLVLASKPNMHKVMETESLLLKQSLDAMLHARLQNCRVLFDDFDMISQGHVSNPLEYFVRIYNSNAQENSVPVPIRTLDKSTCLFSPLGQIDDMVKLVDAFLQTLVHSASNGDFTGAELLNFAASLQRFLFLTEAYRPIQLGIEALLLSTEYNKAASAHPHPGPVSENVLNRLLAWPLNPIMRLDAKELLSLAKVFYAKQKLNLLVHCIVSWIQFDTLVEPSFEPLRCIIMLLAGLCVQEKHGATSVRKTLLQRCIEAKPSKGSIIEILRPQTEAIYSIVPDYKPLEAEQQLHDGDGGEEEGEKDSLGSVEQAEYLATFAKLVNVLDRVNPEDMYVATRKCILATMSICNNTWHHPCPPFKRLDKLFAHCVHEHAKSRHMAVEQEGNASRFYKGVDANLCLRAWATLDKIKGRCAAIMKQLECGIDALNDVVSVLDSVCRAKCKCLTGCVLVALLEHLLDRVDKFNILVPSTLSLGGAALEIETLILQLRHLQLTECRTLVDGQLQQCSQESFVLFPALVEICSSMYQTSNVVVELFQLVMNSPIVQHATIIRQARAVAKIFQDSDNPYEVCARNCMIHFCKFLEQWTPMTREYISKAQVEAQGEIDKILAIVNYSGRQYKAVAESIAKNRRHISSIVTKFTQAVKRPLLQVYTSHVVEDCFNRVDLKHLENERMPKQDEDSIEEILIQALELLQEQGRQWERKQEQEQEQEQERGKLAQLKNQVKRAILNAQEALEQQGVYRSRVYIENVVGWVKWSRKPFACPNAKYKAQLLRGQEILHEALYTMVNIETWLKHDEGLRRQVYVKGVDPMLVGQLVCLLQVTFARLEGWNIGDAAAGGDDSLRVQGGAPEDLDGALEDSGGALGDSDGALEDSGGALGDSDGALGGLDGDREDSGGAYRVSVKDYEAMLAHLDECFMALNQASILDAEFRASVQVLATFKSSIADSVAYEKYRLLKGSQGTLVVTAKFVEDYCGLLDHLQHLRGSSVLFDEHLDGLLMFFDATRCKLVPFEQNGRGEPSGAIEVDIEDILAGARSCRYLAAIIEAQVQLVKLQEPGKEDSNDSKGDLTAGVGLCDASGMTSMNLDENGLEPGNLDGTSTSTRHQDEIENPNEDSVDVDYDFQGDLVDVDLDGGEGLSDEDEEEEDEGGHVDKPREDFKRGKMYEEFNQEGSEEGSDPEDGFGDVKGVEAADAEGDDDGSLGVQGGALEDSGGALKESGAAKEDEGDADEGDDDDDGGSDSEVDDTDSEDSLRVQGGALNDLQESDADSDTSNDTTKDATDADAADVEDSASATTVANSRNYLERPFGSSGTGDNIEPDTDTLDAFQGLEASISSSTEAFGPKWSTVEPGAATSTLPSLQPQLLPRQGQEEGRDFDSLLQNIVNDPQAPKSDKETGIHTVDETSELQGLGYGTGPAPALVDEYNQRFEQSQQPEKRAEIDAHQGAVAEDTHAPREHLKAEHDQLDIQPESMEMDTSNVANITCTFTNATDAVAQSYQQTMDTDKDASGAHACKKTWKEYQEETAAISAHLSQQLKIILEPTRRGGLEGSFKSGKRISIRKLIAFIASNYQRDKIWLRRTRLDKHEYRIILALDDSKSMQICDAGTLALQAFAAIHGAITTAQVGELVVVKFGKTPQVLMQGRGADPQIVLQGMTFAEETRNSHEIGMPAMLEYVLDKLPGHEQDRQVLVIVSDGKFNKTRARPWVQALLRANIVPLLVILDPMGTGSSSSILRMKHVEQRGMLHAKTWGAMGGADGKMVIEPFLANFCFQYYALVHQIQKLPLVLADLLRFVSSAGSCNKHTVNGSKQQTTSAEGCSTSIKIPKVCNCIKMKTSTLVTTLGIALLVRSVAATNPLASLAAVAGLGLADQLVPNAATQTRNIVDAVSSSLGLTNVPQAQFLSQITNKVFRGLDAGTNPINFQGGNLGAYYNFMYPTNDDYPYACHCNEVDLELYRQKQLPYVRCRNQEDLSFQDVQANCDPNNHTHIEL